MVRADILKRGWMLSGLLVACSLVNAQQRESAPRQLNESGKIVVDGQSTPYRIRRLPVSSFPDLPDDFVDQLNRRRCLIPQTYEAHRPENVVHARLERAGSSDWAVLCSAQGTVSLLVFFASTPAKVTVLASAPHPRGPDRYGASPALCGSRCSCGLGDRPPHHLPFLFRERLDCARCSGITPCFAGSVPSPRS